MTNDLEILLRVSEEERDRYERLYHIACGVASWALDENGPDWIAEARSSDEVYELAVAAETESHGGYLIEKRTVGNEPTTYRFHYLNQWLDELRRQGLVAVWPYTVLVPQLENSIWEWRYGLPATTAMSTK